MGKKKELEKKADAIITAAENAATPVEQFCTIWTGIIKPALELVKSFTGPKVDEKIAELEKAADNVCTGNNPDVANYCKIWNTFKIKKLLNAVQLLTGPKVDKALDKFIVISESLCPA